MVRRERQRQRDVAACLLQERGVEVTALVHDALMIHAPIDKLDAQIEIF